jgi:hypothetical protein
VNFFWNYLCCLWLGSEELDLLPEKPAICDSVNPFIVCSFEVLNSSLVATKISVRVEIDMAAVW